MNTFDRGRCIIMHNLKPKEITTSKALLGHDYYLPTTQVANIANVLWNTAKKFLEKIYQLHWIAKLDKGNKDHWRAYRK